METRQRNSSRTRTHGAFDAHCRRRPVTTFDTKVMKVRLSGSAARAAQKRLRRFGARIVSPAHNFDVLGTTGPLGDGELARAREWGAELAGLVLADDRKGVGR